MKQILTTTDEHSLHFSGRGGFAVAHCPTHAGGTWKLQASHPDGVTDEWTDVGDVTLAGKDVLRVYTHQGGRFRFTGGGVGAEIWLQGAEVLGGAE